MAKKLETQVTEILEEEAAQLKKRRRAHRRAFKTTLGANGFIGYQPGVRL
jgi:hypothetical protein